MDDAQMARASVDALAKDYGSREEAELAQRAARERIVAVLRGAGVENEAQLAAADTAALAARAKLREEDVRWFQAAARDALRVDLEEGRATARVMVDATERELPIVPALSSQDGRVLLERAGVDAVLLQEGASTATLRLGEWRIEGLPIVRAGKRVRVARVSERGSAPSSEKKGGLFSRFSKKS